MRVRTLSAVAIAVVLASSGCVDRTGPASDLRASLGELDDPDRFTLTYRAHGSRVVDCFFRNRSFTLEIDQPSMVVAALSADDGTLLASREGDVVTLHRSLFATDTIAESWVEADLQALDAASEEVLRRALGSDLAGYMLARELPASGEAIAVAAAEIAEEVELLGENDEGSTYRISLDAERFAAEAADSDSGAPSTSDAPPPVIDVTIDDVGVSRVIVRPARRENADAAGWSIEFGPLSAPAASPATGPAIAIGRLDDAQLLPRPSEPCTVGVRP